MSKLINIQKKMLKKVSFYQLYLLEQGAWHIVTGQLGHFVNAEVLHEVGLIVESGLVINLIQSLVDQGQGVGALLHIHNIVTFQRFR